MSSTKKRAFGHARLGLFGAILLASGCNGNGIKPFDSAPRNSFKAQYLDARALLDDGSYDDAIEKYGSIVDRSGPMASRVRVEYAHALLRAGLFSEAAKEANLASTQLGGLARSSALSIEATALHEMALEKMDQGIRDRSVYDLFAKSAAVFETISKDLADLDPVGGLQRRYSVVTKTQTDLAKSLGL